MAYQTKESRMAINTSTTYAIDIEDVEYLRHGDTPMLARLFKPRGSGPLPIMVELHGGERDRGDLLSGNTPNETLAKQCVSVEAMAYCDPPGAPVPDTPTYIPTWVA